MNPKSKKLYLLASASLVILLVALFVPLFFVVPLWFVVTVSVWEISHVLALSCAIVIAIIIFTPLIRPSARAWLFPTLFGSILFVSILCATVYTFSITDPSQLHFLPYGLILLAIGALI